MFWGKTCRSGAFLAQVAMSAVRLAAPAARVLQAIKEDFDDNAR